MSDTKKPGFLTIALLLAAVICFMIKQPGTPVPTPPTPDVQTDLSKQIRTALAERPDGTATMFAAFYEGCARHLLKHPDDPASKSRATFELVKETLDLHGSESMGAIVEKHLEPFEGANPNVTEYAAAFVALGKACAAAE